MQETYYTPGEIPSYTAHDTTLPVIGTQGSVGTASFLMDAWYPAYGVRGLYELLVAETSLGAFALLPDASFCPYERLTKEAHLPPEPQHAMIAALQADQSTHDRELVCIVYHASREGAPAGFRLFQKRTYWQVGRYESMPVSTLMEAFHLYQRAKSNTLLLPYPVEQPIPVHSGTR